jgi:hypothetical protein
MANGHNGISTVADCMPTGYVCAANAAQAQPASHVVWGNKRTEHRKRRKVTKMPRLSSRRILSKYVNDNEMNQTLSTMLIDMGANRGSLLHSPCPGTLHIQQLCNVTSGELIATALAIIPVYMPHNIYPIAFVSITLDSRVTIARLR